VLGRVYELNEEMLVFFDLEKKQGICELQEADIWCTKLT
jgi:hypothetical protein